MDESEVHGAIEDMDDEGYEDEGLEIDPYLRLPIPPGSMALRLTRVPHGYSSALAINAYGYNHVATTDEEYMLAGLAWLVSRKAEKVRRLGKKHHKDVFGLDLYRPPVWDRDTELRHSLCVGSA